MQIKSHGEFPVTICSEKQWGRGGGVSTRGTQLHNLVEMLT